MKAYCTVCYRTMDKCPGHVYGEPEERIPGNCQTCNRRKATQGNKNWNDMLCDPCAAERRLASKLASDKLL